MEEENKASCKGDIIFGLINILLVLLCTKLNIILINSAMVLLIIIGIAVSAQSVKENFAAGHKLAAIGCGVGLLMQCTAAVLYVVNILMGLLGMIMQLFK